MRISLARQHKFLGATLFLCFAVLEVICYVAIYYSPLGAYFFYRPSPADYSAYIRIRHPVLGWMYLQKHDVDEVGARRTPAFPDPKAQAPLISLYGDSWSYSAGVDAEHSYANVLSKLVGQRVNNFAVPGYGSDQAYLRFKTQAQDAAKIVVLGHLAGNIARNVTQFHDLIVSPLPLAYSFKPRFLVTTSGELELVPLPTTSYTAEQYADCVRNPEKYLTHDYFIPGGPAGVQKPGFPYLVSILGIPRHYRFRAFLRDEPEDAALYRPDNPSNGLEVTTAIMRAFFHDARTMGKAPVIAIFIEGSDIDYYRKRKEWHYQPLLDKLGHLGIPYVNVGAFLSERVPWQEIPTLFLSGDGHPSVGGCRLQAMAVYEHLVERGLIARDNRAGRLMGQPSASK
jgi:hypothetical protein